MSDLSAIWRVEVMDLDDIAALWKCERNHARDVIVKLDDFPEMLPGCTRKFQRWRRADVLRFAGIEKVPQ